MKTVTYIEMDYDEFDKLVKEYFPRANFEFVADEEMNNDSEKSFGRINKTDMLNWGEWEKTKFNNLILGHSQQGLSPILLQYFVGNVILPEGNYLIKVSW